MRYPAASADCTVGNCTVTWCAAASWVASKSRVAGSVIAVHGNGPPWPCSVCPEDAGGPDTSHGVLPVSPVVTAPCTCPPAALTATDADAVAGGGPGSR